MSECRLTKVQEEIRQHQRQDRLIAIGELIVWGSVLAVVAYFIYSLNQQLNTLKEKKPCSIQSKK